jgi:hypothetical protein
MAGRPTKYDETIVKKTEDYIESCQDTEQQVISGQSDKFTAYKTKVTVNLPTVEGLAYHLRVHRDTIYEWEKQYPEFSDILSVLKNKQAIVLINKALSGDYNPLIAKVLLTKHGYNEKQELEHTGEGLTTYEIVAASQRKKTA